MATRLPPLMRLIPLVCLIAMAPVAGTMLTRTNWTIATPPERAAAVAPGETDTLAPEAPAALAGSEHFRAEAADLLRHVTALLRRIQPERYPAGLQHTIETLISGEAAADLSYWWRLTKQLVSGDPGLSAVVLSCLGVAVLVPAVACVFCCRRCCSGSRLTPPPELTAAQSRCRHNANVAVVVLTLCLIFSVAVLLVAAATLIQSGLRRSGPALGSALADVQTVTTETSGRLTHLLTSDVETAARDTRRIIEDAAHRSTEQITLRLANQSGMTQAFNALFKLDSNLQTVTAGFLSLDADLTNLTAGWPGLVRRLRDLRGDLARTVSLCAEADQHLCASLEPSKLDLAELDINTDRLKPSLSLVRRYRSVDLPALAEAAQASVTSLANSLQASINTVRPGISRELQSSVERAERYLAEARPGLRRLRDHLRTLTERTRSQPLVTEFTATLIWGSALAVPCLVLLVTALLYGAMVGSYFPSRTSSSPHRHTINTIRLALFLLVLAAVLVWMAAAGGALAGGLTQTSLCPEAGHGGPAEVARVMRRMGLRSALRPSTAGPVTPALTETLRQCEAGGSLLTVFDLGHAAEVAAAAQLGTPRLLALVAQVVGQTAKEGQSSLLAGTLDQYLSLASDMIDTDLGTVKSQLEQPSALTTVPGLLSQLSAVLSQLSSDSVRDRLQSVADRLTEIVTGPLYTLHKQKDRLVVQVATFDMSLMSLRGQVNGLLDKIAQVDHFLSTNASRVIRQEEVNFRGQLTARLQDFSNHVQTVLQLEISCRPVWEAFRFAASVTCHQLLGGVSAYWLGCLLTGGLLLLLAAATLPLLTRMDGCQRTLADVHSTEDDSKLWRSTSTEMQQTTVKVGTSTPATEQTSGGGGDDRW